MDSNSVNILDFDIVKVLHNMRRGFRRFGWLILCLALLGGGVSFCLALERYVPLYRCEATFSVSSNLTSNTDVFGYSYYYDSKAAQQAADLFPYIIKSDAMNERLALRLGVPSVNANVNATAIADTNLFVLSAVTLSPDYSYELINAVIEVYPQMGYLMSNNVQLKISQEPVYDDNPYNAFSWHKNTAVGAAVGAFIGFAIIVLWAALERSLHNSNEAKKCMNIEHIGNVPLIRQRRSKKKDNNMLISNVSVDSPFTEAFRTIRLKLVRELTKANAKTVMFTSTLQNEGKTTLAVNTAITLAREGFKVVVVDGDLRNPSVKPLLNIKKQSKGIGDYLEAASLTSMDYILHNETGLYILAGEDKRFDVNNIFKRPRLEKIMEILKKNFDYIIMDAPPCGVTAEALKLCRFVDKVVYVINQDTASQYQILNCVQNIYDNGADICGFIMNGVTEKEGIYKYNYYYKNGYNYRYRYNYRSKSYYGHYGKSHYGSAYGQKKEKKAEKMKKTNSKYGYVSEKSEKKKQ